MASISIIIELPPSITGKVLTDFTFDWCKQIADNSVVSTSGATMTERGNGIYQLTHPSITKDTDFRLHLTSDSRYYACGSWSLSDGNTALETSVNTAGPGSLPVTVEVMAGGVNIDGAAVWITSDLAGLSLVAGTVYTKADGIAHFMLDAGTYYVFRQRAGINFTNPAVIEVT